MPYTVVTSTIKGSPGAAGTFATDPITTTGADLLVAVTNEYDPNVPGTAPVSDSKTNVWTPGTIWVETGASLTTQICFRWAVPASGAFVGASHTFTYTGTGGAHYACLAVIAVSGAHASPFDQELGTEGTSPLSTGSQLPSVPDSLILSACATESTVITAVTEGMTIIQNLAGGGTNLALALAYKIQTTATAINPQWTAGTAPTSVATIIFKPAAGGGGATVDKSRLMLLGVGA